MVEHCMNLQQFRMKRGRRDKPQVILTTECEDRNETALFFFFYMKGFSDFLSEVVDPSERSVLTQ